MLVVSRKKDQTIHIGDGITIRICQINGETVRIGISAPGNEHIIRGELAWDLDGLTNGPECQSQCATQLRSTENMAA